MRANERTEERMAQYSARRFYVIRIHCSLVGFAPFDFEAPSPISLSPFRISLISSSPLVAPSPSGTKPLFQALSPIFWPPNFLSETPSPLFQAPSAPLRCRDPYDAPSTAQSLRFTMCLCINLSQTSMVKFRFLGATLLR